MSTSDETLFQVDQAQPERAPLLGGNYLTPAQLARELGIRTHFAPLAHRTHRPAARCDRPRRVVPARKRCRMVTKQGRSQGPQIEMIPPEVLHAVEAGSHPEGLAAQRGWHTGATYFEHTIFAIDQFQTWCGPSVMPSPS